MTAIPAVCSFFLDCSSSNAPEERVTIGEKAVNFVHGLLEALAKQMSSLVKSHCEMRIDLSSNLLAMKAVGSYVHSYPDKVRFKDKKNLPPVITSGPESEKKNRATPGRSAFMLLQ